MEHYLGTNVMNLTQKHENRNNGWTSHEPEENEHQQQQQQQQQQSNGLSIRQRQRQAVNNITVSLLYVA
jgi:hypothetical protein